VCRGKYLFDAFPIQNDLKQRDALLPLLFNFVLEYPIRKVHVNQEGLELNEMHQLLVYVDINMVKKDKEALSDANREVCLEVNAE
jgi:hypothetical protein